jgi:hypothetical protein
LFTIVFFPCGTDKLNVNGKVSRVIFFKHMITSCWLIHYFLLQYSTYTLAVYVYITNCDSVGKFGITHTGIVCFMHRMLSYCIILSPKWCCSSVSDHPDSMSVLVSSHCNVPLRPWGNRSFWFLWTSGISRTLMT